MLWNKSFDDHYCTYCGGKAEDFHYSAYDFTDQRSSRRVLQFLAQRCRDTFFLIKSFYGQGPKFNIFHQLHIGLVLRKVLLS